MFKNSKAQNILIIFGYLIILAILTLKYGPNLNNISDDAYITLRFAKNLYEHGVFNYNLDLPRKLTTTSPLFALLIFPFYYVTDIEHIPKIANIISVLFIYLSVAVST